MPATRNAHILRNVISGGGKGLFLSCMVLGFFNSTVAATNANRQPDPVHGFIYAYNNHGTFHYISAAQYVGCYLMFVMIPILFLAIAIEPKKNFKYVALGARWETDDPFHAQNWAGAVTVVLAILAAMFFGNQIAGILETYQLIAPADAS